MKEFKVGDLVRILQCDCGAFKGRDTCEKMKYGACNCKGPARITDVVKRSSEGIIYNFTCESFEEFEDCMLYSNRDTFVPLGSESEVEE